MGTRRKHLGAAVFQDRLFVGEYLNVAVAVVEIDDEGDGDVHDEDGKGDDDGGSDG